MNVTKIRYHRNGVSGEGFYAFEFTDDSDGEVIEYKAVIFPLYTEEGETDWEATANRPFTYNPRIAVLSDTVDATWRGDYFLEGLCNAAKTWSQDALHGVPEGTFSFMEG